MRLRRCWCKHEWPAERGASCPNCGRRSEFPVFTRTQVAPGITDDVDDGSTGTIRTLTLSQLQPGVVDDLFVGEIGSPEWERYCERNGF